jgi:hypothetical protein
VGIIYLGVVDAYRNALFAFAVYTASSERMPISEKMQGPRTADDKQLAE